MKNKESIKAFVRGIYYLIFVAAWSLGIYWWYGDITTDTPFYENIKKEYRCGKVYSKEHKKPTDQQYERHIMWVDFEIPGKKRTKRESIDVTEDTFLDNFVGDRVCFEKSRELPFKEIIANIYCWLIFLGSCFMLIVIIIASFNWAFSEK